MQVMYTHTMTLYLTAAVVAAVAVSLSNLHKRACGMAKVLHSNPFRKIKLGTAFAGFFCRPNPRRSARVSGDISLHSCNTQHVSL